MPVSSLSHRDRAGAGVRSAPSRAAERGAEGLGVLPGLERALAEVAGERGAYARAQILTFHLDEHADEVSWRHAFLRALGPREISPAVVALEPAKTPTGAPDLYAGARILGESGRALEPAALVGLLGATEDAVRGIVSHGLYGSDTHGPLPFDLRPHLGDFAAGLGRAAESFGAGEPVVAATLAALVRSRTELYGLEEVRDAEAAGWLVVRSGSEVLRAGFVRRHLPAYRPAAEGSTALAHALAMAMGSMTDPTPALAGLAGLEAGTRSAFFADVVQLGGVVGADLAARSFQADVREAVGDFFSWLARGGGAGGAGVARLGTEAFVAAAPALDHNFWLVGDGLRRSLADLFHHHTEDVVRTLADAAERDPSALAARRPLAGFFHEVVMTNGDTISRLRALQALRRLLELDDAAAGAGMPASEPARDLGFALGALRRAAGRALGEMDDQLARQLAMVRSCGGLVERAIAQAGGPVKLAYDRVQAGSGERAAAEIVFRWLVRTFHEGEVEHGSGKSTDKSEESMLRLADLVFAAAIQQGERLGAGARLPSLPLESGLEESSAPGLGRSLGSRLER